MLNWLRKLFILPKFEDEQKNIVARVLYPLLWAIFFGILANYLVFAIFDPVSRLLMAFVTVIPLLIISGILYLLKRGHTRLVSFSLPLFLLIFLEYFAWTTSGVRSPAFTVLGVVVLLVGLLSGIRGAVIYTAVILLSGVGMLYAEQYNVLPVLYPGMASLVYLSSQVIAIIFAVGILSIVLRSMHGALLRSQRELNDRRAMEKERERILVDLRESEARYRRLAENAQDIIYRFRASVPQEFEYISPAVERITGYTPAEFYQQPDLLLRITHPDEECPLIKVIRSGKASPSMILHRWIAKDGSILWLENQAVPILDEMGNLAAVEGVVRDVTERNQAQSLLVESQKLAALGTLSAGIAHEINSPLQVITGISERTLDRLDKGNGLDKDDLSRGLFIINQNAWRIAGIVRSLLTYARQSDEQMDSYDLKTIVIDTLLLVEHQMKVWSNISIHTTFEEDLPLFFCNRNKIIQVLINLINNARDSMPNGGEITLYGHYRKELDTIELQVSDTGAGIPEMIRNRIFDPFFTTKPIGEGTGLGLSVVLGIVQEHGGEIAVDSIPHSGTTFILRFPVRMPH